MSLPKRLYTPYKAILALVKNSSVDDFNQQLENLLNEAQPTNDVERAQQALVKSMYYSNPRGFMRYINTHDNKVGALVLWTESKRIVRRFDLYKTVHLSWNKETQRYVVNNYVPREPTERKTVWADES